MRLVGTDTVSGQDELEMLRVAAAVEGSTRHPLADAVLLAANDKHLQASHPALHLFKHDAVSKCQQHAAAGVSLATVQT